MRLSQFIQRTRALGDAKVPPAEIDALGEQIERGAELGAILAQRSETLTPRLLLGLWRAAARHRAHLAYLEEVASRRAQTGQCAIPSTLLKQTVTRHEVGVLERAEALSPPGRVAEHRRRDGIKASLSLWNHCLLVARREGVVSVSLDHDHPELEAWAESAEIVEGQTLLSVLPEEWLYLRRGVAAGVVTLDLILPPERLIGFVQSKGAEINAISGGRSPQALLDELVMCDLAEWAMRLKDEEAQLITMRAASERYLERIKATRPTQQVYAFVWVEPDEVGVVVALRDGKRLAHGHTPREAGDDLVKLIEGLISHHPVEAIVISEQLDEVTAAQIKAGFAALEIIEADPTGVDEGRFQDLPVSEGRASNLGRRRVRPLKYIGLMDPLALNLVEPALAIPEALQQAVFKEIHAFGAAGFGVKDLQRPPPPPPKPAPKPQRVLNPTIKSVEDLRPGMNVEGIVTNITQFGAFINIGLSHEGLIHISEMSDQYVSKPEEVLTVGQELTARVLGIDRGRKRISLSLRSGERPALREVGGPPAVKGSVRLDDIPGGRGAARPRRPHSGGHGGG
ncbi:S1 RNA-binding domain-containing protein, partial [Myxococcota bacterium]|nr:S1 RNA-binding domain-containing protein [Myxococcota bacterium]